MMRKLFIVVLVVLAAVSFWHWLEKTRSKSAEKASQYQSVDKTNKLKLVVEPKKLPVSRIKKGKILRPKTELPVAEELPESAQKPVFSVGGKSYRALADAVAAAKPGSTISLLGDAYLRTKVTINKPLRIDLNGFVLQARNSGLKRWQPRGDFSPHNAAITIVGGNKVTIENGYIDVDSSGRDGFSGAVDVVKGENTAESSSEAVNELHNEHPEDAEYDVVMRDIDITNDAKYEAAVKNAEGRLLLDNVRSVIESGASVYTIGADSYTKIVNCDFTSNCEGDSWWNTTVAAAFDGTVVIESGSYTAIKSAEDGSGTAYGTYVFSSGGTIEVNGGEIVAETASRADKSDGWVEEYGISEVVINNGVISGDNVSQTSGETAADMAGISAYGGVYDHLPKAEQVPESRIVVDCGDGIYSVEKAN